MQFKPEIKTIRGWRWGKDGLLYHRDLLAKARVIATEADAMVLETKIIDEKGLAHFEIIKVSGVWRVDRKNQLCFEAKEEKTPRTLTFKGAWETDKNQLVYIVERRQLKTKQKALQKLVFLGCWDYISRNRLVYVLSGSSDSYLELRGQLESINLRRKKGEIKFRLGAGVRYTPRRRTLLLIFGTWKFSRKLGLIFEVEYGKGKVNSMEFGADICLTPNNKIIFALKNKSGEPLGISLIFSHKFLKQLDAEAFLRLRKKFSTESRIEMGLNIPW
ncbi:MAG: hypothetical protein NC928_05520 [Candidatus Omnitrophica bacterium]|nr:hypothetical protein [Candidatus Omnitrophota bacterium]